MTLYVRIPNPIYQSGQFVSCAEMQQWAYREATAEEIEALDVVVKLREEASDNLRVSQAIAEQARQDRHRLDSGEPTTAVETTLNAVGAPPQSSEHARSEFPLYELNCQRIRLLAAERDELKSSGTAWGTGYADGRRDLLAEVDAWLRENGNELHWTWTLADALAAKYVDV